MATQKTLRRKRIHFGIRNKVSGSAEIPRLSVYKSNTTIYAQLVDDIKGHTLASASSKDIGNNKNFKIETAKEVGKKLAEKATGNGIKQVVFDRGGYLYHGRVKALADGAREGGLKF